MSSRDDEVQKTELVYQGSFLRIQRDHVKGSDGIVRKQEFILHPGASAIVPVLDDGRLVMERQYRHPLQREFLEFPAGKMDPGEIPFETARRELLEETGYEAGEWRELTTIHPAIGYSNEFIRIFLAKKLVQKGAKLDPGEELEIVTLSYDELTGAVRNGLVTDVKTLCAYFWYGRVLQEGW